MSNPLEKAEVVSIETTDGWELKTYHFGAKGELPPRSTILVLPAMGSHARPARYMAEYLSSQGHAVLALDLRGHGQSLPKPTRGVDYGFDDFLQKDIPAALSWMKDQYPDTPVFILGHSLGGILGEIFGAENEGAVNGVITLTTSNLSARVLGRKSLLLFVPFLMISKVLGYLPGQHLGWGNPISKTQVKDWAGWGIRNRLHGTDGRLLEPVLAKSLTPMLCIGFSDDLKLAPPHTTEAFAGLFPVGHTQHRTITPEEAGAQKLGHMEHLRNSHYAWQQISDWINVQSKP
ncbi:alpha/beta fold hydrolase [Sneathiella limimaris]|uniref:alpha/beta hydrolase family protein n=1 Tax=Sneathiella limimaris TaxID=1964213 RepID=UPI00146CF932|nr:alpha/beta fold hydrolase [Sneathiella limimaris]